MEAYAGDATVGSRVVVWQPPKDAVRGALMNALLLALLAITACCVYSVRSRRALAPPTAAPGLG